MVTGSASSVAEAAPGVRWLETAEQALAVARERGRPVLVVCERRQHTASVLPWLCARLAARPREPFACLAPGLPSQPDAFPPPLVPPLPAVAGIGVALELEAGGAHEAQRLVEAMERGERDLVCLDGAAPPRWLGGWAFDGQRSGGLPGAWFFLPALQARAEPDAGLRITATLRVR
ncbi:MAG: hypothetical protein D6776_11115, partial [Planctomycetota bacterium]